MFLCNQHSTNNLLCFDADLIATISFKNRRSGTVMDSVTKNNITGNIRADVNETYDIPETIACLPLRLRMKIIVRSEEDLDEPDRKYSNSSTFNTAQRKNNQNNECNREENIQCRILRNSDNQVRKLEVRQKPSEPTKINQEYEDSQVEAFRVGKNIANFTFEKLPRWYERSLEENKAICASLQELPKFNNEIWSIINSQNYMNNWNEFKSLQKEIQRIFQNLLEANLKFCCKENVEIYFWKTLYYNVIEYLKKNMKKTQTYEVELTKHRAMDVILDGSIFYENLLALLKSKYSFSIESKFHEAAAASENKLQLLVRITAQKIYLSLGDLARYDEQIIGGDLYLKAKEYYHLARKLVPTNGIPYNQLAILAIYSKRKLKAVYYHMRSLTSSNPIHSAKESLKVLFDEIRKKFESQLQVKILNQRECTTESCYKLTPIRKEIWIHPNGNRRLYRITPYSSKQLYYLDEEALKELSSDELFKRLQLSYLCIVGKFYTKIGMENFKTMLFQMLSEFREAIARDSFLYNKNRLLQIIALNIFTIECNTIKSGDYETDMDAHAEVKNHSFNVSSLMFGIILNHANEILTAFISSNRSILESRTSDVSKAQFPSCLRILLQAVKIWCEWLALNLPSWLPLPSISNYNLVNEYEMNPWDGFAELLTLLAELPRNDSIDQEDIHYLRLEEDVFLDGFTPILLGTKKVSNLTLCDDVLADTVRIKKLIQFGATFLCHCSPPILKRIANDGKEFFINIANEKDSRIEYNQQPKFQEISSDEDDDVNNENTWNLENKKANFLQNPEISELIERRKELEKRKKMEEKYQQNLHEILREFSNVIRIEVRPKYLVPDTNCFIDSLQELQIITNELSCYCLAVPLVVLNELEGLSKGFKHSSLSLYQVNRSKIHHFDEVSSSASKALKFIRSKNFSVRCVTSKGSFLNTSAFTVEENSDEYQTNDDKILATALNLGKANSDRTDHHVISTTVVLLTTDRNLRVKALSKNLPVSELQEFLRWAKM